MYNDNDTTDYFTRCACAWGLVKAHCQKFGTVSKTLGVRVWVRLVLWVSKLGKITIIY